MNVSNNLLSGSNNIRVVESSIEAIRKTALIDHFIKQKQD